MAKLFYRQIVGCMGTRPRRSDFRLFSDKIIVKYFNTSSFNEKFQLSNIRIFCTTNKKFYSTVKIQKSMKGVVRWRTRDSLSHVSQQRDSQQNQGVSQIFLFFQILTKGQKIVELVLHSTGAKGFNWNLWYVRLKKFEFN